MTVLTIQVVTVSYYTLQNFRELNYHFDITECME